MACFHKFYEDLFLQRLDFVPTTLIVGTFNPAWPEDNPAEWFYGRVPDHPADLDTGNHFWGVLPRIYGQASLKFAGAAPDWKGFCRQQGVAITDLIANILHANPGNRKHVEWLQTYSDKTIATRFANFEETPIVELLKMNPTITRVYLTRGLGAPLWRRLWRPVQAYCDQQGLHHGILLTPCDYCRYQQGKHNRRHPDAPLSREDFVLNEWRKRWHAI